MAGDKDEAFKQWKEDNYPLWNPIDWYAEYQRLVTALRQGVDAGLGSGQTNAATELVLNTALPLAEYLLANHSGQG